MVHVSHYHRISIDNAPGMGRSGPEDRLDTFCLYGVHVSYEFYLGYVVIYEIIYEKSCVMKKIIWVSTVPLTLKTFCLAIFDEIRMHYDLLAVSSPGCDLDVVDRRGTRVRRVRMQRRISPFADLHSLIRLVNLFRRENPYLVHSITPKAGFLSMLAAWIVGVPVRIHSFTGLVFPTSKGIKRKILVTTDKITCACATHILSEGMGVRSDLQKNGITKKRITVLGYGNIRGIDFDYYSRVPNVMEKAAAYRCENGIRDGSFTFLFVGRLVRDKGIVELVDAYRRLRCEGGDIHLIMVGDREEDDPLPSDTIAEISNDPTIHLTDKWVDDVRPYYVASDVLVLPSYREGIPNVVLEAGAFSLPSIVTDINGSREIITDGKNGIVVPACESEALYRAMKSLIGNIEVLKIMGDSARKNVEEKYDARDIREALIKYYCDILGENAGES